MPALHPLFSCISALGSGCDPRSRVVIAHRELTPRSPGLSPLCQEPVSKARSALKHCPPAGILGQGGVPSCGPSALLVSMFTPVGLILNLAVTETHREVPVILCRQLGSRPASAPGCPPGEVSKATARVMGPHEFPREHWSPH